MIFPNRQIAQLTGHGGPVHCVTFSAGLGQYILTGSSDRQIRLFNPLKAPPPISPTSSSITISSTTSISSVGSGLVQTYSAHGYEVLDIAVSEDNARFASVGGDRQVFLWDVAQGRTLRRWSGHGARVNCVGIGGEGGGVVASGSFDATVRLWDTKSQCYKPIQILDDAKDSVSSLSIVGHEIVTGSVDGRMRIYDLRMGMLYVDVIGQPITSLSPPLSSSATPTVLLSTLDSTLRLHDKTNGQLLRAYTSPPFKNTSLRIRSCMGLNDAVVVSGSEDGGIYAWDVLEGEVAERFKGGEGGVHGGKVVSCVTWNKGAGVGAGRGGGVWASGGADGTVNVWGMPL